MMETHEILQLLEWGETVEIVSQEGSNATITLKKEGKKYIFKRTDTNETQIVPFTAVASLLLSLNERMKAK